MASKFMANAAFGARLLLRPSHQRTVWTVNKLKCPIPGRPTLPPILSSRSYSDSTSTPPLPKTSGSTESSQSSGPEDKNWFSPKTWDKIWAWGKTWGTTLGLGAFTLTFIGFVGQETWKDWYKEYQRRVHESARESAIYDKLKKGPIFGETIEHTIPRGALVEEIKQLITPAGESRLYSVIIGEHGTGKTSLIKLAVKGMDEPKGVIYIDVDIDDDSQFDIAEVMRMALGWSPDQVIDSSKPASLWEVLQVFSRLAIKYKQEYGKIPVLIIDNANKLAQRQQRLLDLFQDYAKSAADNGLVSVVFVSSEGRVPRRMMERSSWSRNGDIIEINDVSKEEALQYLKLRKVDEEQAARIYELVGGRMIHLKLIADKIGTNVTLEVMRQKMFSSAEEQLESAEILPELRYHKEGALIIRELLKTKSISRDTLYKLVGVSTARKLLETNIFAYHFNSREITFQSTVMKRFCEEKSALWEGK